MTKENTKQEIIKEVMALKKIYKNDLSFLMIALVNEVAELAVELNYDQAITVTMVEKIVDLKKDREAA
jgi:hypothetical protein